MIGGQKVVCVQHLPGAKAVLRMETVEDMDLQKMVRGAMSDTRKNCIEAGLRIDADAVAQLYGVTSEEIKLYVPIECPKMCLTANGVLRPWTLDVCFGKEQTRQLQGLLRSEFWQAVKMFDKKYSEEQGGEWYSAKEMIEAFCEETNTPDMYADAMRREWQRRTKRANSQAADIS